MNPKSLVMAYSKWCPYCGIAIETAESLSRELKIPLRLLDIDVPNEKKEADLYVRKYGDFSEDYLIPQLFIEYEDGTVQHLFTGASNIETIRAKLKKTLNLS
jgi:glutaredoxin